MLGDTSFPSFTSPLLDLTHFFFLLLSLSLSLSLPPSRCASFYSQFVAMDYLLKDKEASAKGDGDITLYAMGPRAALEIGRRQVIYFCSEILGEQPDPSMLQEVADEGGGMDDDEDVDMEMTMATATTTQ
jgi:hypothetical protein